MYKKSDENMNYPYYWSVPSVKTLREALQYAEQQFYERIFIKYSMKNEIIEKKFSDFLEDVNHCSSLLAERGFYQKHIGLIGEPSYEWIVTYWSVVNLGGVILPFENNLQNKAVIALINEVDVDCLIYDAEHLGIDQQYFEEKNHRDVLFLDMKEFVVSSKAPKYQESVLPLYPVSGDLTAAIYMTSGTTGKSKGVILTHTNLTTTIAGAGFSPTVNKDSVNLLILPLHHIFGIHTMLHAMIMGYSICISGSVKYFRKNLQLYHPTYIETVPLFVNSLYKDILLYISQEQEGDYKTKVEYCRTHPELDMMERRNIFQPIHDKFLGGRIDTFFCGGAYLDAAVGEFFHIIGIEVFNAYGITECAPNISTNTWYCRRINSVGIILPHMKLRIEEDEIVLSGDNITKGYYKQPELTAAAIKDGWFYTGDLGRVDEDNYLYITGRKKNLIILSNGENISPEEIEQAMYKYEIVKEVVVYEDNDTIVAEVFCDCTDIEKSQIAEIMQEAVKDYNDQNPWYRQIHTLKLREVEFEKTASGKIMRNINRRTSNEGNNN